MVSSPVSNTNINRINHSQSNELNYNSRKHQRTTTNSTDDLQRTNSQFNRTYAQALTLNSTSTSRLPNIAVDDDIDTRSDSTDTTDLNMRIDKVGFISLSKNEKLVIRQIKSSMTELFNNAITKRKNIDNEIDQMNRSIDRLSNHINNNTCPKSYGTAIKLQLKQHDHYSHIQSMYEQQFHELNCKIRDETLKAHQLVLQELINKRQTYIDDCYTTLTTEVSKIITDYTELFSKYNSVYDTTKVTNSINGMILHELQNRIHLYELSSIKQKQNAQRKLELKLQRDAELKAQEIAKQQEIHDNADPTIRDQIAIEVQKQLRTILAKYNLTDSKLKSMTNDKNKTTQSNKSIRNDKSDRNSRSNKSSHNTNSPSTKNSTGGQQKPKSKTATVLPPTTEIVVQGKPTKRPPRSKKAKGTGNPDKDGKVQKKPSKVSLTHHA